MAKSVNQVILLGRLTNDVDLRTTTNGKTVASFTLAVDKAGKQEGADFFDVTAWDKLAELLNQYTSKGSKLLVQGRIEQQTWDDKETGKKRSKVVVIANDTTFLDNRAGGGSTDNAPEDIDDKPIDLGEIPF